MKPVRKRKLKSFYIWHRYAGILSAIFVIFISITGIALNHTDTLALSKHFVGNAILLDAYQVKPAQVVRQFTHNEQVVTQTDNLVFINQNKQLSDQSDTLIGVGQVGDYLALVWPSRIHLFDQQQLVATLGDEDLIPKNIFLVGQTDVNNLALQTANGIFQLNQNIELTPVLPDHKISWSRVNALSDDQKNHAQQLYRSNIISMQTLMLDLHSGRLLGDYGSLFFDVVGVCLLFLAFSGLYIWTRQRKSHRTKR